jgi:murein tripeptide amidase MpaA
MLATFNLCAQAQDILPPVLTWKGKSEQLIVKKTNPWITPVERSDFNNTPNYKETFEWLGKLCNSSKSMRMVGIGKTANNRDINMVIASSEGAFDKESIARSVKPALLIQAGIHAGEIDGKDAGMMLLRDILYGNKEHLLRDVNILFVPILNADGHERASEFNRVNQRGPSNMGWRTNARNLNLNRDYTKVDTEEIRAVIGVMNAYDPDLYLDLHVTDGADYQYDITYGFSEGYSPAISQWLKNKLSPAVDSHLKSMGHIPGPLIFATNNRDFQDGMIEYPYSARFSNNYGDVRHLPSILVENHSLKPFRQRVLGTYVLLEAVIQSLSRDGASLKKAIEQDRGARKSDVVLTWKAAEKVDSVNLLGISSVRKTSTITGQDYVEWLGKAVVQRIPFIRNNQPDKIVKKPKSYIIPGTYKEVIERLKIHGVRMEAVAEPVNLPVGMYRYTNYKFSAEPFEGHVGVKGVVVLENTTETFYPGSVRIDTDQPLGNLVVYLLEPDSPDSFLQWGFFPEIFNRTEYIEEYAIEPLARKMLANDENLRSEFAQRKKNDPKFANDPQAIYEWFYARSPYVDAKYLLYPVGITN